MSLKKLLSTAALVLLMSSAHVQAGNSVQILDSRAEQLLASDASIQVLGTGFAWTEGPLWIPENGERQTGSGYLLFSDIPNNVIHRYQPGEGVSVFLTESGASGLKPGDSSQGSNGLLLNEDGQLVLFQHGDRRVAIMDAALDQPASRFITLVDAYQSQRLNSPNDGVFSRSGDLYFTDPPYGLANGLTDPNRELTFQGVYHLSSSRELTLLDDQVTAPNGIALSLDERTLFVAVSDEENPHWLAYDLSTDGSVSNKRLFYDANEAAMNEPGLPDGMAVHSSGHIFATGPGGVWLFSETGELLARILTGRPTANCTLAGDESVLYITANDALLALPLLRQSP
ncbi:MAG: SMP-30/gluconolactonase/LRE family protein [Pseudomonadota bacterium]